MSKAASLFSARHLALHLALRQMIHVVSKAQVQRSEMESLAQGRIAKNPAYKC